MNPCSLATLLVALQHADSQFPSGGFAFSQGLEASSLQSDYLGRFDLPGFLDIQLRHRWAYSDRIALVRSHRRNGVLHHIGDIDREVEVSTFSAGLREGSRKNGVALLTAHSRIGTPGAAEYRDLVQGGEAPGHLAVVQGLVWKAVGLDESAAAAISGYQAAVTLTTAAVRLGLTGAIEAQVHLQNCLLAIGEICSQPVADDEALRSFNPLAEIAVSTHGLGGQRLFFN